MRFATLLPLLLPLAVVGAACSATNNQPPGSGGAGTGGSATTSVTQTLAITPADAVLELIDGQTASLGYNAAVVTPDSKSDVTGSAVFTVDDPTLGGFEGAKFTAKGTPGKLKVHAEAQGLAADTTLTLKKTTIVVTPGAPADAPSKFGGTVDPSKAPTLVYPADGVLVPPNMNVLEMHFMKGGTNDLFELAFSTASVTVKVYLTCQPLNAGCAYTPDANVWKLIADAARGSEPVEYTLRGVSMASPATVGVSATQKISFALEDMLGGLYYWNAAAGATMRYEFGKSGQSAELYMNAPQASAGICVGCHVLSRDGKRIVEGLDFPGSVYRVFDVATKTVTFSQPDSMGGSFFSFSPDSSQIIVNDTLGMVIRDAATGATVNGSLGQGAMPDWAPDGKRIVYAKGQGGVVGVSNASLETLTFDGTSWSSGPTLVPYGGQNNYYPSYSPDSAWVIFNRASGDSYDAPTARVWAVAAAGGQPIQLTAASAMNGGDSWPKWAPLAQTYKQGKLMWLTFSSRRAYGLRLAGGQTAQIWMTAFDPARAAMGMDPSYPAFWLPFQDLASGNHIAQWVLHVERKPCTQTSDCDPGESCANGTCEPIPK